jgi:HEAT repeat protein
LHSPAERRAAVRAIGGSPSDVEALGDLLRREDDPTVREAIFTSLARTASPESVAVALPYLRSDDATRRTEALDALRAMPGAVAPQMGALLQDPDPDVRLLACEIARDLPADEATALLSALLDRELEVNVCASAVEVLAEVGEPEALPALTRAAARFQSEAFLNFAIKAAADRIRVQRAGPA